MININPEDPHDGQPVLYGGTNVANASAAMIMIHGRGADAESILSLADELDKEDRFIFAAPQASGNTWYPYSFLAPRPNNEPGITSALNVIRNLINSLVRDGIVEEKIILLGFSQGACLALEYSAQNAARYGGIIGLSGGLIGDRINNSLYKGDFNGTPVFLGCSDIDPHIPLERVDESGKIFSGLGAKLTKRIYPNMGHTINEDELRFINLIMNEVI
ncbi:MAG: dienelactone hydrolase family protein [Ignavibacteriaceae bacterium]